MQENELKVVWNTPTPLRVILQDFEFPAGFIGAEKCLEETAEVGTC